MTDDTKLAIFEEIAAITESQYMQPGDITATEYRNARRISQAQAATEIRRAVEAGLLVDLGLLLNPETGRQVRAYRKAML